MRLDSDTGLFGPDGTADPGPLPRYPDPLAGLVAGVEVPPEAPRPTDRDTMTVRAKAPAVLGPDSDEVQRAMALLAGEDDPVVTPAAERTQHQRTQRPQTQRAQQPRSHQPRAQQQRVQQRPQQQRPQQQRPQRPQPQRPPQRQQPASNQWRQTVPRGPVRPPRRKQSGTLIVFLIFLAVVLFNVASALFNWLESLFH